MMTTINQFRDELKKEVGFLMPAYEMRDAEIVKFNDRKLVGFTAVRPGEFGGPTIWANDFMPGAEHGISVREMAQHITTSFLAIPNDIEELRKMTAEGSLPDMAFEKIRPRIRARIADKALNAEFLADKPYRELEAGFALFASVDLGDPSKGHGFCTITNGLAKDEGYDEGRLFDAAIENVKPHMLPLHAALFSTETGRAMPNLLDDPSLYDKEDKTFLLTNEDSFLGAAALFAPEIKERIFDMMGSYYVLPSSIHEVLLLPEDDCDEPAALIRMIGEANASVVADEDILSNRLLLFDGKELKEVTCNV